jgi:hypothetical protein
VERTRAPKSPDARMADDEVAGHRLAGPQRDRAVGRRPGHLAAQLNADGGLLDHGAQERLVQDTAAHRQHPVQAVPEVRDAHRAEGRSGGPAHRRAGDRVPGRPERPVHPQCAQDRQPVGLQEEAGPHGPDVRRPLEHDDRSSHPGEQEGGGHSSDPGADDGHPRTGEVHGPDHRAEPSRADRPAAAVQRAVRTTAPRSCRARVRASSQEPGTAQNDHAT